MKATFKNREDKLFYQSRYYFSVYDTNGRLCDNQQFVVPWQLQEDDDGKNRVKAEMDKLH